MDWFLENFFWLVVGAVFIWMHVKMHGGHGHGHGGHEHGGHEGSHRAPQGDEATRNEGEAPGPRVDEHAEH